MGVRVGFMAVMWSLGWFGFLARYIPASSIFGGVKFLFQWKYKSCKVHYERVIIL